MRNNLELVDKHHMHQVVDVPTREANTLDLLFTTDPNYFHTTEAVDMGTESDHNLINISSEFSVGILDNAPASPFSIGIGKYNFERANHDKMKECLKEVYHEALPCQSSIYGSCPIPEQEGVRPARILLSPLLKNFKVFRVKRLTGF